MIENALGSTAECELDQTVDDEADPEINEQSPVEMVGSVARGIGEMRHEDEKVKQVADEDGGELLEQAGEHSLRDSVEEVASREQAPLAEGRNILLPTLARWRGLGWGTRIVAGKGLFGWRRVTAA